MSKLYTKRPDHWQDKKSDNANKTSIISEYQSGKVQKNVASDKAIKQEDYDNGNRKILKASKEITESSKGDLSITEEAKNKFKQQSNTASEKIFADKYEEKVIDTTEIIESDSSNITYKANTTTFDFKTYTEIGNVGQTQIKATKNINITNFENLQIIGQEIKETAINSKTTSKKHITKTPQIRVKAGQVEQKFENLTMDKDIYQSTFEKQDYQARETSELEDYEKEPSTYYIGEVIYVSSSKKLYFINKEDCYKAFRISSKMFVKADVDNETIFNHYNEDALSFRSKREDKDYSSAILDKGYVFAISLVRPSMTVINESKLTSLNTLVLDFNNSYLDDKKLFNWSSIDSDLKGKLGSKYKAVSFANKEAVNNGITMLHRLSDKSQNQWLDIGKTRDTSSLYMGLNLSSRYNYKQMIQRQATLVNRPVFDATIDFDEEQALVETAYYQVKDEENGCFKLEATELLRNGAPLLSSDYKLEYQNKKYLLKATDSKRYSQDNEIKEATLIWKQATNLEYNYDELVTLRLATLYKDAGTTKQLTTPFEVTYKADLDKWLIYLDSTYMFKSQFSRTTRVPKDYPKGDAFCMEMTTQDYVLEHFMYQQLARHGFELPETTISKDAFEAYQRRCLYQALVNTYNVPVDTKVKEFLESVQNDGKTTGIAKVLENINNVPNELILALPPCAVGKLLYCVINADLLEYEESQLDSIRRQQMLVCLRLLATINTKKGYLKALQNYQPLTEDAQVNEEDSVDAIWHKMSSPLYFKDYGDKVSPDYGHVYGAYKVMNSLDMELKNRETTFTKHDFTVFPYVDVEHERKADAIVKQLKDGEITLQNGHPLTKLKLFSKNIPIQPVIASGYLITGTISLDGDIAVEDTTTNLTETELTIDRKKKIEAKAKADLGNVLGSLSILNADPYATKPNITFNSDLGLFSLNIDTSKTLRLPDGSIKIAGDLSNSSQEIDTEVKGNKLKGNLTLGFDLLLKNSNKEEAVSAVSSAVLAKAVAIGTAAAATAYVVSLFIPGVGEIVAGATAATAIANS